MTDQTQINVPSSSETFVEPRHDEVFLQGQQWLDELAGGSVEPSEGTLTIEGPLWDSECDVMPDGAKEAWESALYALLRACKADQKDEAPDLIADALKRSSPKLARRVGEILAPEGHPVAKGLLDVATRTLTQIQKRE